MTANPKNDLALEADERVLVIERVFDAPRELVWDAFTNPKHLLQWMGPRKHPSKVFEAEVRPGGKWRGCLESRDGKEKLWQGGVYHEVTRPERLVYTFQWEKQSDDDFTFATLISIHFFEEDDGRTRMHFQQTYFNTRANRDGHNVGWNSAFDRLADFLAKEQA
jgi:uncharacterized protein YndB with AHSA1/START domain